MRTTDLFKNNRSSKRLNESLAKTFGTKLDLESFDTPKLEDARNKLRTQIHTARQASGFNETIENETLTQAQFMHDAIVAELMDRQEHIVDTAVQEDPKTDPDELFNQWMNSEYAPFDDDSGDDKVVFDKALRFLDGQVPEDDIESYAEELADRFHGGTYDDDGGETDDNYALASAGFGSDEDYESINNEGESKYTDVSIAQDVYAENPDLDSEDDILNAAFPHVVKMMGGNKKRANYLFNYDEDFPGEMISAYKWLQRQEHDVGEATGRDAYQRDYDASVSGMGRRERENDEGNTEPPNNFAVSINGKQWKVFKGRGQYADDSAERKHYYQLKDWAAKKSESTGKKWTVSITGENPTESLELDEISWKGIKQGAAAAGLAGALALGSGAAQARVSGDEDPGVNRLTGKPNVTQVAPSDSKPSSLPSLSSRYGPDYEGSPSAYTITVKGQDYKFAGRDKDGPGTGPIIKVPGGAVGIRGLSPVAVELGKDGTFYIAPK